MHAHFVPGGLVAVDSRFRLVDDATWGRVLRHGDRIMGPMPERLTEIDAVLADMDARRIDVRALTTTSWLTCYWAEPALGQEIARATNELIAAQATAYPQRLVGLATLPLQDIGRSLEELEYAVGRLGLRGVAAGTNVNGRYLDDPSFEPLFEAAERLRVPIFFHPDDVAGADRMADYYLTRLLGNPHEVALALARLILGGVVERFPAARLCFPMGGGSLPFLLGRVENGWRVRGEANAHTERPPAESLRSCYFDTIVHGPEALSFAIATVPATQFMLGSDYPWDMGEPDPVRAVEALDLDDDDRRRVLGGNAVQLLRLD